MTTVEMLTWIYEKRRTNFVQDEFTDPRICRNILV